MPTPENTPAAASVARLRVLFDAENEAKHKAGSDLATWIWHAGRANAFAQILAGVEREEKP